MQIKLPTMGTGVPNTFSGSAMRVQKPAGRLREMGQNIKLNEKVVKSTVESFNNKAEQYARSPQKKMNIKA
ncbi:MAG: hypothetical protein HZA04_04135 [Nitrospinae bacterium]|nr:hypothetical protein [Nitrospinota bacterium]